VGKRQVVVDVLGTWQTAIFPFAAFSTWVAVNAVSSPPMVMRYLTFSSVRALMTFAILAGSLVGFSRDVRMIEPPRIWMRDISSGWSFWYWVVSPLDSHLKPS